MTSDQVNDDARRSTQYELARIVATALVTALALLSFAAALVRGFSSALTYGYGHWGLTDWLINYAGGFVRRGLPGQILAALSEVSGVQANHIAIAVSFSLYLALVAALFTMARGRFSAAVLVSPLLVGALAYQFGIVRKDSLTVLLLIACLRIFQLRIGRAARIVAINILGIVGTLTHEAFFFISFPIVVVTIWTTETSDSPLRPRGLVNALLAVSPMLASFLAVSHFHGDHDIAHAVNASWAPLWAAIEPGGCCFDNPSAAIDALQWSVQQGLSLPISVLTSFDRGIYVPAAWLLTILVCLVYLVGLLRPQSDDTDGVERGRLASVLAFQLLATTPLFVLGWDFGRWIFLWTMSSAVVYLLGIGLDRSETERVALVMAGVMARPVHAIRPREWHLFAFGFPVWGWTVDAFLQSTPAWQLTMSMMNALQRILS